MRYVEQSDEKSWVPGWLMGGHNEETRINNMLNDLKEYVES